MAFGSDILAARSPLSVLERRLDDRAWRAAATLWSTWRWRARRTRVAHHAVPGLGANADVESITLALADALAAGALNWAIEYGTQLTKLLRPDCSRHQSRACALVLETLLLEGNTSAALRFAERHERGLLATPNGQSLLELVNRGAGKPWLLNGHPNMLGLSLRVARGSLDAEQLAVELGTMTRRWLRFPELRLLFYNALWPGIPERGVAFLSSYLALGGSPTAQLNSVGGRTLSVLEDIKFEPAARIERGPLVSIAVAARNAATTIGPAIGSLLSQSYRPIEILVCDDASDDATMERLRQYFGHEHRVRLFRSLRNQGAYNARNALFQEARGEYFAIHDADDIALPHRISLQLRTLTQHGASACVGNWLRMRPDGSIVFFKDQRASRLCLASMMLTRSAYQRFGPYRTVRYGADLELYADLRAQLGPRSFVRLAAPIVLGLWSPSSVTRSEVAASLENGYRAPGRRTYSELVHRKHAPGPNRIGETELGEMLAKLGNNIEPSPLIKF